MRVLNSSILACCGLVAVLTVVSGCNKHNDEYHGDYTVVDTGSGGGGGRSNVVTEPAKMYPIIEDKAKGIKYAVLQQGSLVTSNLDGWQGLSAEFFSQLSGGIAIKAPEEDKMMHRGYSNMPMDIKASTEHPERKAANIYANYLVPKEMNGWVAVDQDTFAKLIKEFMSK